MVNTIHMSCVHYKSPSTEYTSLRLFSTLSSRRAHIFFLWMFKWLKWNAFRRQINVCRPKEHISSNHDRWLNSFNIKQFHKINFYVVERTILQTCLGPIEFLHVSTMLLNSYRFFSRKQWNTKQMLLNQHHDGHIFTWEFQRHKNGNNAS